MMIFIMIFTYQITQFIQKWRLSIVIKANQISILIGIFVGFLALIKYSHEALNELR